MSATIVKDVKCLHINYKAREWCKLPYPDHPYGCPNVGEKAICPPDAPLVENFFNLSTPLHLVAIEFDMANHMRRMRTLNPNWSDRQARCVLYWQGGVNNRLDLAAWQFCNDDGGKVYTLCPEAMGVNVIATAQEAGIPVKVKPTDTVYKIALVGEPR